MNNEKVLSKFIIQKRKEKGYSQRKLAAISGLSNTTISRIENGEIDNPEIETLIKIAETLKIDKDVLISIAYSETVTLKGEELPKELLDIGMEYLEINKEMKERGISPEDIRKILEILGKK